MTKGMPRSHRVLFPLALSALSLYAALRWNRRISREVARTVLGWACAAVLASPASIAVIDFESNGVDAATTTGVADELVNGFIAQGRYGVLERRRMDQILKEQGFQKSGACDNGDCSVEVGKLLGVDAIVSGSLTKIDKLLVANIRIVDVGTGLILFATQVRTEEGLSHLLGTDLKTVSEQF